MVGNTGQFPNFSLRRSSSFQIEEFSSDEEEEEERLQTLGQDFYLSFVLGDAAINIFQAFILGNAVFRRSILEFH